MPRPICVACKRFYRPKKNGQYVLEQMPVENGAEPGTATEDQWVPYKLWMADLWSCQGCGHEMIYGYGANPIAIHHEYRFSENLAAAKAFGLKVVNDC